MYNGYQQLIERYASYRQYLAESVEEEISETADDLEAEMKKRIFDDGKDSFDSTIADSYSTKPITVTQKMFVRPSAFSGKKTMKLNYGYKELRDIQGLPTDKVHLQYSGRMRNAFKAKGQRLSIVMGFNDNDERDKALMLQRRFGTIIFSPTSEELRNQRDMLAKKLKEKFRSHFGKS